MNNDYKNLTTSDYELYLSNLIDARVHQGNAFFQTDVEHPRLPRVLECDGENLSYNFLDGHQAFSILQTAYDHSGSDNKFDYYKDFWVEKSSLFNFYQYNLEVDNLRMDEADVSFSDNFSSNDIKTRLLSESILRDEEYERNKSKYLRNSSNKAKVTLNVVEPVVGFFQNRFTSFDPENDLYFSSSNSKPQNFLVYNYSQLSHMPELPSRCQSFKLLVPKSNFGFDYTVFIDFKKSDAELAAKMIDTRISALNNDPVKAVVYSMAKYLICASAEIPYKVSDIPSLNKDQKITFEDINNAVFLAGRIGERANTINNSKDIALVSRLKSYESDLDKFVEHNKSVEKNKSIENNKSDEKSKSDNKVVKKVTRKNVSKSKKTAKSKGTGIGD